MCGEFGKLGDSDDFGKSLMIPLILLIFMNLVILVSGLSGDSGKSSDSGESIDPANFGASGAFC